MQTSKKILNLFLIGSLILGVISTAKADEEQDIRRQIDELDVEIARQAQSKNEGPDPRLIDRVSDARFKLADILDRKNDSLNRNGYYQETNRRQTVGFSDGAGEQITGSTDETVVNLSAKLKPLFKWINANYDVSAETGAFFKKGGDYRDIITEAKLHEICQENHVALDCAQVIDYRLKNGQLNITQLANAKESLKIKQENSKLDNERKALKEKCLSITDMGKYTSEQDEGFKQVAKTYKEKLDAYIAVINKNEQNKNSFYCNSQKSELITAKNAYDKVKTAINERCDLVDLKEKSEEGSVDLLSLRSDVNAEEVADSLLYQIGIDANDSEIPFNATQISGSNVTVRMKTEEKKKIASVDFLKRLKEMEDNNRLPKSCGKVNLPDADKIANNPSLIFSNYYTPGSAAPKPWFLQSRLASAGFLVIVNPLHWSRAKAAFKNTFNMNDASPKSSNFPMDNITLVTVGTLQIDNCKKESVVNSTGRTEVVAETEKEGIKTKTVFNLSANGENVLGIHSVSSVMAPEVNLANFSAPRKLVEKAIDPKDKKLAATHQEFSCNNAMDVIMTNEAGKSVTTYIKPVSINCGQSAYGYSCTASDR